MRLDLVLNRDAGTLKGSDPDAVARELAEILRAGGHDVRAQALAGGAAVSAVGQICRDKASDAIIAGGGDGTISAAAAAAAQSGMALGVLPLGTMNLFARALSIPLEATAAAEALAASETVEVDIGAVNGRYFTHHVTLGLHPRMVRLRDRLSYGSRLSKIWASGQALWIVVRQPPRLDVEIRVDGETLRRRTAAILVSNNPLGAGHLPHADDLTRGRLGVYVATSRRLHHLAQLTAQIILGDVADNPLLERWQARDVTIAPAADRVRASVDGEIVWLDTPLQFTVHPGGLTVLKPRS